MKSKGQIPQNTLVCGDSGNDIEFFLVEGVHGVIVSDHSKDQNCFWVQGLYQVAFCNAYCWLQVDTMSEGRGYQLEVRSQRNGGAVVDSGRSRLSAWASEGALERARERSSDEYFLFMFPLAFYWSFFPFLSLTRVPLEP
jgi:hypothetical protein